MKSHRTCDNVVTPSSIITNKMDPEYFHIFYISNNCPKLILYINCIMQEKRQLITWICKYWIFQNIQSFISSVWYFSDPVNVYSKSYIYMGFARDLKLVKKWGLNIFWRFIYLCRKYRILKKLTSSVVHLKAGISSVRSLIWIIYNFWLFYQIKPNKTK